MATVDRRPTTERLAELLRECTAMVFVDGRAVGTAFFITDSHLLTCGHVIAAGQVLEIEPFRRARRPARQIRPATDRCDVTLLGVDALPGEPLQPCVLLDDRLEGSQYHLAAYRAEHGTPAGLEVQPIGAVVREGFDNGRPVILAVSPGTIVSQGMSGGPVLNGETGAVVAIMQSSLNPGEAVGGGAIPVAHVMEAHDEVRRLVREPPIVVRTWRDVMGQDMWQALGHTWHMEDRIDVWVSGAQKRWRISLPDTIGVDQDISGRDLGDEVAEAIFRWAQGRVIKAKDAVELVGQLLSQALFPQAASDHLQKLNGLDDILVRLHIAQDNDMADIPWELAMVPGQRGFLAADRQFRFVRIVEAGDGRITSRLDAADVRVVAVVAQPKSWRFPVVNASQGLTVKWPALPEIADRLRSTVQSAGFTLRLVGSAQLSEVKAQLPDADVFHFIGPARLSYRGEPQICLVDDDGDEDWRSLDDLLCELAAHRVKVVVLQFMTPPVNREAAEPVTPSSLARLVRPGIGAVVLTRFPVHPKQFQQFNNHFYERLGQRESVETAVQDGRRALEQNQPLEDAAGFGWFMLVTGYQSEIRLVSRQLKDPGRSKLKQPVATDLWSEGDYHEETGHDLGG